MDRILITGGCGFVGSNLIGYLMNSADMKIRVFDNESIGNRKNIEEFDVEFVHGDITDNKALIAAVDGVKAVVHLAADTRVIDSINDPTHNFVTNVVGSFNLLNCMREAGITVLVNASTGGAILGEIAPPVNEEMVPNPQSPYGASKLAVEGYCSAFGSSYGLKIASLRFSNVYGPRSYHKGSVVANFFKRIMTGQDLVIYGDGTQTRDYVFIEDLCEGIRKALEAGKSGVYQLGTGRAVSINELIELIWQTVGEAYKVSVRYLDFRAGEVRNTWCNISKARRELGYEPSTVLEEGLKKTWAWFQNSY